MKTKAIFIGRHGSMGLDFGREYSVTLSIRFGRIYVSWGMLECPYDTMRALLKNWRFDY